MSLKGKTAIVTGGAKGIGEAIVKRLYQDGSNVVIVAHKSYDQAQKLAESLNGKAECQAKAVAFQTDVANLNQVSKMVNEAAKKFPTLDILVNNAGVTKDNLLLRLSEEDWDLVLDTNLKGAFNTIKAISRYMLKQKSGRIVNISSVVGIMGNAGQVNYSASKAGLIGLTKSVAKELASRNITVNAVAPGYILTDMTEKLSEEAKNALLSLIPLKKPGTAEDVANLVAYLVSDQASYITGQVIKVDGGMLM
ncbi:MAG: 3-oxoacyl-[acyl-carrier-protein] reductase [candidate division Zixibacteria bacterium RBG_16_40_9]|nr:MAG: 3-oxoacyl-[acyl-carrier-protein] reductase [candidate division Zixibacteria bacterium RBG_16_40_9]